MAHRQRSHKGGHPRSIGRASTYPLRRLLNVPLRTVLVGITALLIMDVMRNLLAGDGDPFTWHYYLGVIVFSVLLGLVLNMSLQGHGYVPGNGETGETLELDIRESHGFYWRS